MTTGTNDIENEVLIAADAFVVACGAYCAPLVRSVGVDLPIDPGKGYSATFRQPES